ncbi:MAG: enoyl-CoA hydratase/isomerase family protein [Hyphomicrobium sp.]|uniref:enoyl-CoA hydratase/isomerase family protein n=1 Tax=Hyphomicrobium sp. TaxID=82 RepID=UPI0025C702C8|nr:enoyl-CoA hydratase/isomerase family protein [Hyphomicrobium sp.]MBZ0209987.1 enoyl-CoA hydratase/isomerase family protein [Hyphomicrobium sp.]
MQHETATAQMTAEGSAEQSANELLIEARGSCAVITLNRPRALNALNTAMRARLAEAFPRFAREAQTYCVVIQSASEKAFSAGGDVREIVRWGREDLERARRAFAEEYALNWLHECFSKPTISLIDGPVMGSGVGITLFGTHRVAGERYRFAMPETAIGLFPDVGTAWSLSRLPNSIGMYLGLTGRSIGAADAYALGLLTHCIPAVRYEEIKAALADTWPVDTILDERQVDPGPGELAPYAPLIARCFSAPAVEEIIARLEAVEGAQRDWAHVVVADLRARSPLSLKVTHRHIRAARALDLRQTLSIDYRLACRCLDGHDFYEGVRAALIDKDGNPRWRPDTLEEVTPAMVEDYFTPMGPAELALPTRQEMQAARV